MCQPYHLLSVHLLPASVLILKCLLDVLMKVQIADVTQPGSFRLRLALNCESGLD